MDGDLDDSALNDNNNDITFAAGTTVSGRSIMTLESTTGAIRPAGAVTLTAGGGMVVHDDLHDSVPNQPLVLNADSEQGGVGTLTVYPTKSIKTLDGALQLTAWDIDLQDHWVGDQWYGSEIDAGTGSVEIFGSKPDQSIGLGLTSQNMHVTDSELVRIKGTGSVSFTRFGGGAIVVNSVSLKYSTRVDAIVFGDASGEGVMTSLTQSAGIPQVKIQSYATAADFVPVSGQSRLEVVNTVVSMGSDIVVKWYPDVYSGRLSGQQDWIGIYEKDSCIDEGSALHRCYLAWHYTPPGQTVGEMRFSMSDYKSAGEFEARYFFGDSADGQGYRCLSLGSTGSTYKQCMLQSRVFSEKIHVKQVSALTNHPGLVEKFCDGSKKVCE